MSKISLSINNKEYQHSIEGAPPFRCGKEELLSNKKTDITFDQDWYLKGHKSLSFLNENEFKKLKKGLTSCIQNIIESEIGIKIEDFTIEKYHKYITTNEDHMKVVRKTRDLFSEDFNFSIMEMLPKLGGLLGFELTDTNPKDNHKVHIIVRINRPFSNDFNPPHKDIYENFDKDSYIPRLVNFWIPIAGVTENSSLPIAPASHLITEDKINRTFDGGVVEGNKYRVRMIKEWDGSNKLERAKVNYGEVLIFTSHLIHGMAINEEKDTTRVALEFRLFKKSHVE